MTRAPDAVLEAVRECLDGGLRQDETGEATVPSRTFPGGGSGHRAGRVDIGDRALFLKWADAPTAAFELEATHLNAIRHAGEPLIRVPGVMGHGTDPAFLCLEWVEPGLSIAGWGERLGRGLAALHRERSDRFGWERDGWIGALPQANAARERWPRFWWEARIEPQLRTAATAGHLGPAEVDLFERMRERLVDALAIGDAEGPSLLHGDLWSGNVFPDGEGRPVLFDPSTYHGHREVDLAMAELFGGFPPGFREAYESTWPLEPGYTEARRPAYQAYYLLVHLNLFGDSYREPCVRAARAVLAATR